MNFAHPEWLTVLAGVLAGSVVLYLAAESARRRALGLFASPAALKLLVRGVDPLRRILAFAGVVLALLLLCLALAGPRWGTRSEEARARGIDLMIALDVSRSMLADDFRPSRLDRAKIAIRDLLNRCPGDRVGLVAFAGEAFLQCPLTLDHYAVQQALDACTPDVIPVGGTDIGKALEEADAALPDEGNHRMVILITDGEDHGNGAVIAKKLSEKGLSVYAVGVGTEEGSFIPVKTASGAVSYLKDENGVVVKSRHDPASLKALSEAGKGFYVPLGGAGEGLRYVQESFLSKIPPQERESHTIKVFIQRFQLFLLPAFLLLILESVMPAIPSIAFRNALDAGRKRFLKGSLAAGAALKKIIPACLLGLGLMASGDVEAAEPPPASAESQPEAASPAVDVASQSALEWYRQGKFDEAVLRIKNDLEKAPADPFLRFVEGCALYRLERYPEAVESLRKALYGADLPLQAKVFYNLGNAQFRLGEQVLEGRKADDLKTAAKASPDLIQAARLALEDARASVALPPVERKPVWERSEAALKPLEAALNEAATVAPLASKALNDWSQSLDAFRSSAELQKSAQTSENLSWVQQHFDALFQAQESFLELSESAPDVIAALNEAIRQLKRPSERVLEAQQKALQYIESGQFENAYQLLKKTAEEDPTSLVFSDLLQRLEQFFSKMGETPVP